MVFSVRHGETKLNVQDKVCGITDISLTQNGIEQAKVLAHALKEKRVDLIISSPMIRAKQTAEIIAEQINAKIIFDERLVEQNYGDFENVSRLDENYSKNRSQFAVRYPNGESCLQTTQRIYNFLDEMKKLYANKNILIVSHGGVCRIINTYFCDMSNQDFADFRMINCEIKEYSFSVIC